MMFIFIIIVIAAVYLLMDSKNSKSGNGNGSGSYNEGNSEARGIDVLNERFALGEIDEEEYLNKKRLLQNK